MKRWLAAPDVIEPPAALFLADINLIMAAKWAGVAPWELAQKPLGWLDWIETAMEMERAATSAGAGK
jgi:hypothetical protein